MPLPIVRPVLICKAMNFAYKAMEFDQHFVNIGVQSKTPLPGKQNLLPCKSKHACQWATAQGITSCGYVNKTPYQLCAESFRSGKKNRLPWS